MRGSHEIMPGPSSKGDLIALCISCCPLSPIMGLASSIPELGIGVFEVGVVDDDFVVDDLVVDVESRAQC